MKCGRDLAAASATLFFTAALSSALFSDGALHRFTATLFFNGSSYCALLSSAYLSSALSLDRFSDGAFFSSAHGAAVGDFTCVMAGVVALHEAVIRVAGSETPIPGAIEVVEVVEMSGAGVPVGGDVFIKAPDTAAVGFAHEVAAGDGLQVATDIVVTGAAQAAHIRGLLLILCGHHNLVGEGGAACADSSATTSAMASDGGVITSAQTCIVLQIDSGAGGDHCALGGSPAGVVVARSEVGCPYSGNPSALQSLTARELVSSVLGGCRRH